MDSKNKIGFFLLSFLLSFSLFCIGQKYVATDLIAYILGIFLIGSVPTILYFIWPKLNKISAGFLTLTGLGLLYLAFPMVNKDPINNFFIEHNSDIIAVLIVSLIITVFLKKFHKKLSFSTHKYPLIKYLSYLLVFLLIFFLIYNPKYKYSLEKLSLFGYESFHEYHHVTYFLSPIHEILFGKTLLINASSFYGILSTYFNSFVFRFINLTYPNFVLYDTLVAITYTTLFFIIFKKTTKSFWLALIGTLAFIRLAFFRDFSPNVEIFIFPSTTPIRYFFDIIIFYLIFYNFQRPFNFKRLLALSAVVMFFLFYSFDYGFFVLIAYSATIAFDIFLAIFNREKLSTILTKINKYIFSLVIPLVLFGLCLYFFTFLRSGVLPNLSRYISFLFFETSQFKDRTFPTVIGWQHLPLLIYLAGFCFIFYQALIKKRTDHHELVFLLVLGLLTFTYYINMSEPNHLFPFLHPAVIIFIFLLNSFKNKLKELKIYTPSALIFVLIVFFFGVLWAIFMYPQPFISLISDRLKSRYSPITIKYYYWNYPGTQFYLQDDDGKNFKLAVDKIRQYAKNDKEIVIISRYSALLYIMSDKTSLINHPNIESDVYSNQDYFESLDLIKTLRPKYVFVHSEEYNQSYFSGMDTLWDKIKKDYRFKENAGAVDVYQLIK